LFIKEEFFPTYCFQLIFFYLEPTKTIRGDLRKPKIVCSPSYVDIRSRANTTRGFDYKHMIKARAHKGGVRIGKTPKKLASICCP
jgi:hypothetical protein